MPGQALGPDPGAGGTPPGPGLYDHLAGRLGVAVTQALIERQALVACDGEPDSLRRPGEPLSARLPGQPYQLGLAAVRVFAGLGRPASALAPAPRQARPLLRFYLDWSEQRRHLGGRLGADMFATMESAGWPDGPASAPST